MTAFYFPLNLEPISISHAAATAADFLQGATRRPTCTLCTLERSNKVMKKIRPVPTKDDRAFNGLPDQPWRSQYAGGTMKSIYALACGLTITAFALPAFAAEGPAFRVDPSWPKTLPNNWIMGQAAGVAVDAQDHIWVLQRPRSLTDDEKASS